MPSHFPNRVAPSVTVDDLEEVLARHHAAAFGWALACCCWDRAAAEDVLQIAYLKILERRARYDGHSAFATFLFGVVRLTAKEERRRHAIRSMFSLGPAEANRPHTAPDGLALVIDDETATRLVAALKKLSSRQRAVLHLVFYQDLSIAGAAKVMDISLGAARSHYERGKANLRRLLDATE